MAHSSCDAKVGYIIWPRIAGFRKLLDMLSRYLMCAEVAISQQILL